MSKSSLRDILELLPEPCLERAILDCLQDMFAKGEWERVSEYLDPILEIPGHQLFKAYALSLGVKCAVRLNDLVLALDRFDRLSALGEDGGIINSMADALLQLASLLLPDNPGQLLKLWRLLLQEHLPVDAQDICCHIGQMLMRQSEKNHDEIAGSQVRELARRHLLIPYREQRS